MTQTRITYFLLLALLVGFTACSDDDTPTVDPPSSGAIIAPNVGGPTQPNQVFIDLSSAEQSAVNRSTWDLGFYTGTQFRVILNNSTSALARPIDKTDLNEVTAADTAGFGAQLDIDAIFGSLFGRPPAWLSDVTSWTDDPSGDLSKTAIAEVAASAGNNKVYIINRGKNPDGSKRGWMKIRVLRNSDNYTLQYAPINSASFQELSITKDQDFDFVYASFDNGTVSVAPKKTEWDFVFTVFTNVLSVSPTTSIPYAFKDYIISNGKHVSVAKVEVNDNTTYDAFTFGDAQGLDYSSDPTAIGSGWRTIAQPGSNQETGVKTDIFYVIKDADENYYKLRFTRLVDPTSGERGNPQFQYELLTQQP